MNSQEKQNLKKKLVAAAAVKYLEQNNLLENNIIGIGTGSTTNEFIKELAKVKHLIKGTVSSSNASTELLKSYDIPVFELNEINGLSVYIDGADAANSYGHLIKGLGGALTREKILANSADVFLCIIDDSKLVKILGRKGLVPIEVIPMARSRVAQEIKKLSSHAEVIFRDNFRTDNGNEIIDVRNFVITEPATVEQKINNIPGVVTNGIFAIRPADQILMATDNEIKKII